MEDYTIIRNMKLTQGSEVLFTSGQGARGDYDWAYYWWDKVMDAAGLVEKQYTIYQLRHTRITSWVRGGMELLAVRRTAGHRDIRTTERYAQIDDQDVRGEMKKCGR
jgi:site-specific recombinase XerD